MSDHYVAVYGSLKKGFYNHGHLDNAKYLGAYHTEARYTMLNLDYFPGLLDEGSTRIHVEIYGVTEEQLGRLDVLEGHPRFFRRDLRPINGFSSAWLYLVSDRYHASIDMIDDRVIADGLWLEST